VGLDLFGLGADIEAGHRARAAAGAEDAAKHTDGGRLARPVRPQEAEYLAFGYLEVQVINGSELASKWVLEPLRQTLDFYG
jgi:hypothetical protein